MAGDVADGLFGHPMCPPRWIDEVMAPSFEKGLGRCTASEMPRPRLQIGEYQRKIVDEFGPPK